MASHLASQRHGRHEMRAYLPSKASHGDRGLLGGLRKINMMEQQVSTTGKLRKNAGNLLVGKALDDIVRGSTLTDQVYGQLRRGLLTGVWKPGEKITARQLSRRLGVSLTPAREAIIRLADEGAIDVSETRMFSIPTVGRARYREITDIRLSLESMAVGLAAEGADRRLSGRLTALNDRMRDLIRQGVFDEALQLDSEFHLTLYDAARSPDLRRIIDGLWLVAGPTRNRLSHEYRSSLLGFDNHRIIIGALQNHDPVAAKEALRKDLVDGANTIMDDLDP